MSSPSDLPRARRPRADAPDPPSLGPLAVALVAYAGFLGLLVTQSVRAVLAGEVVPVRSRVIRETIALELAGAAIVIAAVVLCGRPQYFPPKRRLRTWLLAAPLFLVAIAGNVGYTLALRWVVRTFGGEIPDLPDGAEIDLSTGVWTAIALVCVQPAVIEELFFRHVLMGHLRPHLGMHLAVWVTAVAFGLAHIGTVGGWPVLVLVGAGLGYARALSGNLALPMVLHFLHNLAVLYADTLLPK